jgi:hypothetical protein
MRRLVVLMGDANEPLPYRKGSRVRLKEGFDLVYPMSFPGAEAIIGAYTIDPEKYERIFVEWDKSHWRYNYERDMLTYASHFEVIAPPEVEPEIVPELPEPAVNASAHPEASPEFLKRLMAAAEEEIGDESLVDQFASVLSKATETMADGTAFMLVTVSPEPGGSGKLAPYFFSAMLDNESAHAAQLAFAQIAGDVLKSLSMLYRSNSE